MRTEHWPPWQLLAVGLSLQNILVGILEAGGAAEVLLFVLSPATGLLPALAHGVQVRPHLSLALGAPGTGGQRYSSSCAKEPPAGAPHSQQEARQPVWAQLTRVPGTSLEDGVRMKFCRNLFALLLSLRLNMHAARYLLTLMHCPDRTPPLPAIEQWPV